MLVKLLKVMDGEGQGGGGKGAAGLTDNERRLLGLLHADVVVVDEGHRLKNDKSETTRALNRCHTRRRIILTGTPIQNNLSEYYCMLEWVVPGLLTRGNKGRFDAHYKAVIEKGRMADSSLTEIRLGRRRSHSLFLKIDPIVQRRDEKVLSAMLPPMKQ
jgi:transcriptional regulator ATRX